jgi:hypothetical protein
MNGKLIMVVMTRFKLQSQIIGLQTVLLHIYENGPLHSNHPLNHSASISTHMHNLARTAHSARLSAISALAAQHTRMLADLADEKPRSEPSLRLPGAYPAPSSPSTPRSHLAPPNSSSNGPGKQLFCIYARDLQSSPLLPLSDNFKPAGDFRCPYCSAHIASRLSTAWEIPKRSTSTATTTIPGQKGSVGIVRRFLIGTRFLVKSHREGGGFACVLCREYRDSDTVMGDMRALVEHLWAEHSEAELEWDDDVGESA